MTIKHTIFTLIFLLVPFLNYAQINLGNSEIDYANPVEYTIAGVTVTGADNTDGNAVKLFSGLQIGDKVKVPGEEITRAIRNLWKQRLFADIKINAAQINGNDIYLNIDVKEVPRLSRFRIKGIRKSEVDKVREKIRLVRGTMVNENLIANTISLINDFYEEKGYYSAKVSINSQDDEVLDNSVFLTIDINKGERVKIEEIYLEGVTAIKHRKVKKALKDTKEVAWWRIFGGSKYLENKFADDKRSLLSMYNELGYRNAKIMSDSIWLVSSDRLGVKLKVHEGNQFYFNNVSFVGNTKYKTDVLNDYLGVKKGDVYNQTLLDSRLYMSANGRDISSLYMDNGYLSFTPQPVEVSVANDSIDIEIRLFEGKQYRINNIYITGNTKTNEHVIRREIRTRPGDLFNRSDIIRTQRELSQLGYFNPEAFQVNPIQNPEDGTVDIEYVVEEKPSDQIELSGGWGAGTVVGTLGVSFNNFSMKNVFNGKAWSPYPSGDGQRINIRAQSNGSWYQAYNFSFTEPWLGGRKPNALSFGVNHSVNTNGQSKWIRDSEGNKSVNPDRQTLKITGASVGMSQRLNFPDDYFTMYNGLAYQQYKLDDFQSYFIFSDGTSNILSYNFSIGRNSTDEPIYPRRGADIKLSVKATPPYSLFNNKDYTGLTTAEKNEWVEYHKWKFTASWYSELAPKLVLNARLGMGFLGNYNNAVGNSPFERFYLGGVPLSGFVLDGRELIYLRGYDDQSISSENGDIALMKYSFELRYLLSPNPSATIYGLGFMEAGNSWGNFEDINSFELKRSTGFGLRIFLPMFGLLGLDYGWRLDDVPSLPNMAKGQFHFTIGLNLGEL